MRGVTQLANPNVTVIIPVFNSEKYISRCLDSLLSQTYHNFRVICVDDCSKDKSLDIIYSYIDKFDGRLSVMVNEQNIGGGASRMRAVSEVCSGYVMFLDSDDFLKSDYIDAYLRAAKSSGDPDIVVGGYVKDYGNRQKAYAASSFPWCLTTYSISCAKMYKTSFLHESGAEFSDIRCGEDILFGLLLYVAKPRCVVMDYCGYCYYFNPGSTTNSMRSEDAMEHNVAQIFDQFNKLHGVPLNDNERYVVEYAYVANMLNSLIVYSRGCGPNSMVSKVRYIEKDRKRRFPNLSNNPLLSFRGAKGQSFKIRSAVSLFRLAYRLGVSAFFCRLLSR